MVCGSYSINNAGAHNRRFPTYQRLVVQRVDHRWRNIVYCLTGHVFTQEHQKSARDVDERHEGAHTYIMVDIGGRRLGHIAGVSTEGDIRLPHAVIFAWGGGFHGVLIVANYMVDSHGLRAVVMYSVTRCFLW